MKTRKPTTAPYRESTQFTKSNNDKDLSLMYSLTSPKIDTKKKLIV